MDQLFGGIRIFTTPVSSSLWRYLAVSAGRLQSLVASHLYGGPLSRPQQLAERWFADQIPITTEALSDILVHDHRSDIYPVHVRTYVRRSRSRAHISVLIAIVMLENNYNYFISLFP